MFHFHLFWQIQMPRTIIFGWWGLMKIHYIISFHDHNFINMNAFWGLKSQWTNLVYNKTFPSCFSISESCVYIESHIIACIFGMRFNENSLYDDFRWPQLHQCRRFLSSTKSHWTNLEHNKTLPSCSSILESCVYIEMSQPVFLVMRLNENSLHDIFQWP